MSQIFDIYFPDCGFFLDYIIIIIKIHMLLSMVTGNSDSENILIYCFFIIHACGSQNASLLVRL